MALAYYQIIERSPLYLFPYWLEETHLPQVAKMDSLAISKFCQEIGRQQQEKVRVEKVFDLLKNEMDGERLSAHNQYNTDARLFINFLSLIVLSELIRKMRKGNLFKKYTVRELLAELRKIKYSVINGQTMISEISKKQRLIFEALEIDKNLIHRY